MLTCQQYLTYGKMICFDKAFKQEDNKTFDRWWSTPFLMTSWAFWVQNPNIFANSLINGSHDNNDNSNLAMFNSICPGPGTITTLSNVEKKAFLWFLLCSSRNVFRSLKLTPYQFPHYSYCIWKCCLKGLLHTHTIHYHYEEKSIFDGCTHRFNH